MYVFKGIYTCVLYVYTDLVYVFVIVFILSMKVSKSFYFSVRIYTCRYTKRIFCTCDLKQNLLVNTFSFEEHMYYITMVCIEIQLFSSLLLPPPLSLPPSLSLPFSFHTYKIYTYACSEVLIIFKVTYVLCICLTVIIIFIHTQVYLYEYECSQQCFDN